MHEIWQNLWSIRNKTQIFSDNRDEKQKRKLFYNVLRKIHNSLDSFEVCLFHYLFISFDFSLLLSNGVW